jgi:DNA-directed RNA polymerase II subunit RPB2
MVCPCETPEGQTVGLIKNLSLMAYISTGSAQAPILEFLEEFGTENLTDLSSPKVIADSSTCNVFVNGNWIGIHRDPEKLVTTLRESRRAVDIEVSRRERSEREGGPREREGRGGESGADGEGERRA